MREGSARATTNRIAERAGIRVGSLYQYFDRKDAIFDALLKENFGRVMAAISQGLQARGETRRMADRRVLGVRRIVLPTGYLRQASGEVGLDPDEEVQLAVRTVFEEFEDIGTTHGVLPALVACGMQIGVRHRPRPDLGRLEWRWVHRGMILNILRNPIYAPVYACGRRQFDSGLGGLARGARRCCWLRSSGKCACAPI